MKIGSKFGRTIGFLFLVGAILVLSDTATAAGGSWGGSWGGSRGGSWGGGSGGSWGGGSGGSGGSWGSGGSVGIAYRTPVRNMLGNIRERMADRRSVRVASRQMNGGSWGSGGYGSTGNGSFGSGGGMYVSASNGSLGSSYAASSSAAGYGSWGSSYVSTIGNSYSSPIETGFAMPMGDVDYGYMDAGVMSGGIPIDSSMSTAPGYYEGSGIPIEGGGVIYPSEGAPQSIIDGSGFDPGVTPPSDGLDRGRIETPPIPRPSEDAGDTMILPKSDDSVASNLAILSLKLPREAQVFINDRLTRTEGDVRSYVSRRAQPGQPNEYRIKAVVKRDGKEIVRTQTVNLEPGLKKTVSLDFDKPAVTTLALKVPSEATVRLCGSGTAAVGRTRYYATRSLEDGQVWKDYKIEVSVVRDGKTITREQTIDLVAGEMRLVSFDFAVDQVVTK